MSLASRPLPLFFVSLSLSLWNATVRLLRAGRSCYEKQRGKRGTRTASARPRGSPTSSPPLFSRRTGMLPASARFPRFPRLVRARARPRLRKKDGSDTAKKSADPTKDNLCISPPPNTSSLFFFEKAAQEKAYAAGFPQERGSLRRKKGTQVSEMLTEKV